MGIIVQKYGGSSVADVGRLRRVAARIVETHRAGHKVVAVVSAMGKTTDELLTLAREVSPEPGRRELDMLVSVGERIAMTLLSMAVSELGVQAISFTGSQSGIITDTSHFNAQIVEVRPLRLLEALKKDQVIIVAGYQGVSIDKEVTTLGRGGTDTTAVALAAALGADHCEICSDVDGVYSGDPRVIDDPVHIDALGYDEMLALSRAGAKVLAASAVAWAKRRGVTIHAASTFGDPSRFTRISGVEPQTGVVAVTGDAAAIRLRWEGPAEEVGAALTWCASVGIVPRGVSVSPAPGGRSSLALWFRAHETPDLGRIALEGAERYAGALSLDESLGTVTLVGHGVAQSPLEVAAGISQVAAAGIKVREAVADGPALTLTVLREEVVEAQRALHALVGRPDAPL